MSNIIFFLFYVENRTIPLQVCYWGGYCGESLNPNSVDNSKNPVLVGWIQKYSNQIKALVALNYDCSLRIMNNEY